MFVQTSDFIYHTAWYEFEFLTWIRKIWNNSESSESSAIRKWERTLLFTLEFSFKALYAQLIEWAATSSYEAPVTDIFVMISANDSIEENQDLKIIIEQNGNMIIGITRWGAFTETIINLSNQDIEILEISGNDEILVSVIMDKLQTLNSGNEKLLYESRIVTNDELKRNVYLVPVNELLSFTSNAISKNITIEHIYDY